MNGREIAETVGRVVVVVCSASKALLRVFTSL